MGLIGEVTLINQNIHIPSVLASEYVAREVLSKEIEKIANQEKEVKVNKVKEVEKVEKILPDKKRHIDLKV